MQIVDSKADELPLVIDAWATSYRRSPWAGCIPNHAWNRVIREGISDILERPTAVVQVAVADLEDGSRRVMGYYVAEPERRILHWVFVKHDCRRLGIGRALLASACAGDDKWRYTFRTRASARFLGARFEFDPIPARIK